MDGIMSPTNSYANALTPGVTVYKNRVIEGVIRVECGYKGGALTDRTGVLVRRGRAHRSMRAEESTPHRA